jgi:hypothetical protein
VSPSRAAGWVRMAVTRTTFAVLGNGLNDVSVLSRTGADAPFGMLRAQPQPGLAGHPVWVAQAWPLLVVAGDFVPDDEDPDTPEDPKASGLLQLALP